MANSLPNRVNPQEKPDLTPAPGQPQVEQVPVTGFEVEKNVEMIPSQQAAEVTSQEGQAGPELLVKPTIAPPAISAVKSPALEKIEDILEEDLEQIYFQMPPEKQAEFNKVGIETATKIALLLGDVKIKVKKILELITAWLKIIPGVNKYFLRQESKIKTDKILELKDQGVVPITQDKNKI